MSRFAGAVAYAQAHESQMDRDIGAALAGGHFSEPLPDGEIIGPVRPRGNPSGMTWHRGEVTSWGPVDTPDMTFSVTKGYLALIAGLAWADGLIDLDAPCRELVPNLFDAPQNQAITWTHLLQQTSEWEGALWGKADRIDRNRSLDTAPGEPSMKGTHRDLAKPGTFWEYNDIRVNVLSLALMRVFRRPLPEVLRDRIMDPISASHEWEWHGYANSWEEVDGRRIQSVSGGAHWGGGLMIPTSDHLAVGRLMLQRGAWNGKQLIPEAWIDRCLESCPLNPGYGFLWWLNRNGETAPSAPATSYFAIGVGRNAIWIDPDLDLVAVVRWIDKDAFDGFCNRVLTEMG
ncbi:MAG: serine hydrolase [Pseudomonadota bacterium]